VNPNELAVILVFVAVLLGLAGYFGWRQVQTLRRLRLQTELPPEDQNYYKHQSWRRLVGCALMILLAALLSGWYLLGFDTQTVALSMRGNSTDTAAACATASDTPRIALAPSFPLFAVPSSARRS